MNVKASCSSMLIAAILIDQLLSYTFMFFFVTKCFLITNEKTFSSKKSNCRLLCFFLKNIKNTNSRKIFIWYLAF